MEIINVIVAAAASWLFGAVYYMTLSKPWLAAAQIECDENGKPLNSSALPFVLSAICMLLVAGMMRHVFAASGVASLGAAAVSGFGVGAFFIAPWTMINNAYGGRPFMLTVIDGGYAICGCTLIGIVLALF